MQVVDNGSGWKHSSPPASLHVPWSAGPAPRVVDFSGVTVSYTVLARKYRSQSFDEVVGQAAIVQTLRNAIRTGRVHHGYLFCGTRGVGKTSMARILAKALNCLAADGPTETPCGQCDACKLIAEGEDLDVIEIDAASNTGVDNIRELRSNSVLRPARCRFKIYIIDEVHMLSTGAFNALLKTLEEPPSHIKFILATTDAHKVPATIQSRVQRFDFRPIQIDEIAGQLAKICEHEKVAADPAALRRIARLATGSMRDALSLMDQLLSLCGPKLSVGELEAVLPPAHDELLAKLIDKLADGDAAGALAMVDESLGRGETPDQWCANLITQLRDLMVVRVCGPETDLVDVPAALRVPIAAQAQRFDGAAYVYMISVLEELRRSVKFSGSSRALVEAAVVRLAEAPKFSSIESLMARLDGGAPAAKPAARSAAPPVPAPAFDKKKVTPVGIEAVSLSAGVNRLESGSAAHRPETGATPVPPVPVGRATREELEAAYKDPMVRQAMQVFGGRLMSVRREPPAPQPPQQQEAD
jgi:DNA polymerase-3 subunit gamma/tau